MKYMRAAEVERFIKAHGSNIEQPIIKCLVQAFERMSALEQQNQELGLQMLQMAKIIDQVTTGAGNMRTQIEKMQGGGDDDDLPFAQD